jgi:glycosyltransferase involved in cell wall biosynthesis
VIKPNFIASDPGIQSSGSLGAYALFLARLEPAKGVETMLRAWQNLAIPLRIRGGGQLEDATRAYIREHDGGNIEIVDRLSPAELEHLIKGARFLIWPSEGFYETFGFAAVECFASGIPVIASRIGVMTEIIRDGVTGLHFNAGDPMDLATKVRWLWDHPRESKRMGQNARREYEQKYTPERNYAMLMDIYSKTISEYKR